MLDNVLRIIAPHYCYGCDVQGTVLCDNCKYNIVSEPFLGCIECGVPSRNGVCTSHALPYSKAWVVGERNGMLAELIDDFKFNRVRAAHTALAALYDDVLPQLPNNTIVVAVPTIPSHVRRRGYDQMKLVGKEFAHSRRLDFRQTLQHVSRTTQRGSSKRERISQAKQAFRAKPIDNNRPYLLLDDVMTTGATMRFAAETLKEAGANDVWVAALARQPLDKQL